MTYPALLRLFAALALATAILGWSLPARAVSCTINGKVEIQSKDQYYCDTTVLGSAACDGWRETDLDTGSKPMQYMYLKVYNPYGPQTKFTSTNQYGDWSVTLTGLPNCTVDVVTVTYWFARVHEADVGLASPRWRFWVTGITNNEPNSIITATAEQIELDGNPTAWSKKFYRSSTGVYTRSANVYHTVSSAMKEITGWSTNLETGFTTPNASTPLRVGYDAGYDPGGGGSAGPWGFVISYNAYTLGALIRHEFGHLVHAQIHQRERSSQCESPNFKYTTAGANHNCEYGAFATKEGLPNFVAVRSVTSATNSNNVFACKCLQLDDPPADADKCSDLAAGVNDADGDGLTDCNGYDNFMAPDNFFGISDNWSSSPSDCVQLREDQGCDCSGSPCETSFIQSRGWRNPAQIARFLWDLIDPTTDSGQDDADYGITEVIAALESMPCSGNQGGVDGSCEEQAVPLTRPLGSPLGGCGGVLLPPCTCEPEVDGETTPTGTGTRDSYNMYDFAQALPGSEYSERVLNCVQGAPD